MDKCSKIFVMGHTGLVGSAIVRKLALNGYRDVVIKPHIEFDLADQAVVHKVIDYEKPEYIILAAAKVGGIYANSTYPADFIYHNLMIQTNVINAANVYGVKKLLFLGSSCIYPRDCPQPIKEEYLLTGPLEETNEAYAVAKIAGIKMCQAYNKQYSTNFICAMPTNLYGPRDNYHLENAHVLPALIRKFHEAKIKRKPEVAVWGTGKALREFLYVDDLADACVFLLENYNSSEPINVGTGESISIKDLAEKIRDVVGYSGKIIYDTSKPDGTPKKELDVSKIHKLGWHHTTTLGEGLRKTYTAFLLG